MRGAMGNETGIPQALAALIHGELSGLAGEPLGIDVPDTTTLLALQAEGIHVADSQPVMLSARKIKTEDELALLDHAAGIVDAVYEVIYRMLRPGVTENEVVAAAMKVLFELGSEHVEAINAISGDRCNPHPHTFADRLLRPGDQAFFDIIHSFMGYRTCYYRTFNVSYATPSQLDAYKQCREWLDAAIELVRPGVTTDQIAEVWPAADDFGMKDEHAAFGLQFGHGLGVGLYEAPMISRLHSFDAPVELEVGMVFALETYCPASDGRSAARIEEVVVTPTGPDVITRFPADELLVAGRNYVRGADFVNGRVAEEPVEVGGWWRRATCSAPTLGRRQMPRSPSSSTAGCCSSAASRIRAEPLPAQRGVWHDASLLRPGSRGSRLRKRARAGRSRRLHVPRPRPSAGHGHRSRRRCSPSSSAVRAASTAAAPGR